MLSCQRNSAKVHETYYQIFQLPTVVDMLESISINAYGCIGNVLRCKRCFTVVHLHFISHGGILLSSPFVLRVAGIYRTITRHPISNSPH